MNETPDVQQFAQAAADLCGHEWAQTDGACVGCTAKAIAAAEERGRRAGIEEAAKRVELDCPCHGPRPQSWCKYCRLAVDIRALAPRDSGKECGYLLSRDLGAEWRCGKPKGHEGAHSGAKP